MQTSKLYHPVLNVKIAGELSKARPSYFGLSTDSSFPDIRSLLEYPAETANCKADDPIEITLTANGESHVLFTGLVYFVSVDRGYCYVTLADGYSNLCCARIKAAYRKENAKVILQDILEKSGITKTAITCPAVELARFSTDTVRAEWGIIQLIKALEEHGHAGLSFFFDETDTFHFGTINDTGKNDGAVYEFETAKNILKKGDGWIEVLPLPIRHSQEIVLDSVQTLVQRTELHISGSTSRLRLYYKGRAHD